MVNDDKDFGVFISILPGDSITSQKTWIFCSTGMQTAHFTLLCLLIVI